MKIKNITILNIVFESGGGLVIETIIIIDSGIENIYPNVVGGINISIDGDKIIFTDDYIDNFGHGTAIYHLINDNCKDIQFFIIKIFDESFTTDQRLLLSALTYVYDNINCKFIVISSGTIICNNIKLISNVIDNLFYHKNVYVISAFDNNAALSFPASHDKVIGIDSSERVTPIENYYITKGSPINILSTKRTHRLRWLNNQKIIQSGNSFLTAEYASKLINSYIKSKITDKEALLESIIFKNNVLSIENKEYKKLKRSLSSNLIIDKEKKLKAIAFPFSKEIQVLAANENLLKVDIINYCDIKQSGKVGLTINNLLDFCENEKRIKDIYAIDWEDDFDAIILGHCNLLKSLSNTDWFKIIIELAVKNDKYVYSFDPFEIKYEKFFAPPTINNFRGETFGKLWQINVPVLGIFGTSSQQGKFSLQLQLRKKFLEVGYNISQISTEPSGCLLGIEYTCPIGYNASINLMEDEMAMFFNDVMHDCALNDPDIIIVGCQSGTIPHNRFHSSQLTFKQYEFLIGTMPDAVLLLVNPFDEISYIKRTISFIESSIDCSVVSCVVSPIKTKFPVSFNSCDELSGKIGKSVYLFDDIENIFSSVINFFGG